MKEEESMKKFNMVFIIILLGSGLMLGSFPVLHAQETASNEFTLEEIIVTAEKREVNVQKTAMNIAAISGDDISSKSISNVHDVLDSLAAVKVMGGAMGGNIYIRGIGSGFDTNEAPPSVALQKDNVYLGNSEAVMGSLYDIERVEVLYGPQGTMYGKNAAGGQVNVITKNPTDKFESTGSLSVGTYNLMNYSAAINVPFSSKWAARLAIDQQKHDGYISDGSMSSDKFASRIKLSYKPTDKFSVLFTSEFSWDKSSMTNTVPVPGSAGKLSANTNWQVPDANGDGVADDLGGYDSKGTWVATPNGIADIVDTGWVAQYGGDAWTNDIYHPRPKNNTKYQLYSLKIDWDMGWSKLTVIPTLNRNSRDLWSSLIEGIAVKGTDMMNMTYEEKQWSGEARLASVEDSPLIWTIGAYWFKANNQRMGETETDLRASVADTWANGGGGGGPGGPGSGGGGVSTLAPYTSDNPSVANYRLPQDSLAAFGQATYPVTDRFRVVGGLRWNRDNNNMKMRVIIWNVTQNGLYSQYYANTVAVDDPNAPGGVRHEYDTGIFKYTLNSSPLTYKGGLEYDLDTNKMLYLNVTTGFKAGGLNTAGTFPPVAYDPEEVVNYSIGAKNRFMNNQLQLNFEAYYYDYKGYQVMIHGNFCDTLRKAWTSGQTIQNAKTGTNSGLEINGDWMITAEDKLSVTFAYMKTKFGKLVLPGNWGAAGTDLTGHDLPKAPHLSGTLGYEHVFSLEDGATVTPKFQTKISEGFWNTYETYQVGSYTDAYTMSDFYLTYVNASGKYSTGLWVKNLENSVVTDYAYPLYRRIIMAPRTSGITFSAKF